MYVPAMHEPPSTIYVRPPVWALIACVVIGGVFYLMGKNIDSMNMNQASITVSGDAKVSVSPDIGMATFGVETGPQPTAKGARELLTKRMEAVLKAALDTGVEKKDLGTEQFSLSPSYDYTSQGQRLRGYEAREILRVKVRDLDKVADVLTAAMAAGANQAGDVSFTVDNPDAPREEARKMAIEEAQAKAAVLAKSLGVKLGRLRGFNEDGGYPYAPPMMMRGDSLTANAVAEQKLELPVGETDVNVSVSLTYDIE